MTYDEALAFWYGRINYEVKAAQPADLKLERMRAFLARLGHPQDRLRIVHITGTKGKGSTSAMLAAALRAAGYRAGLFTSPHLVRVEERIRVDDEPITPGELAALVGEIAPDVRALEASPGGAGPTFFEIGTALGFLHFIRRRVEVAVVEVGLGGRFDSTNVCAPLVSVITSVGLDHTVQLGTTLEAIAYQKAGIIKPGVPVVSGVTQPGPGAVVKRVAAAERAPLIELGQDFNFSYSLSGGREPSECAIVKGAHTPRSRGGIPVVEVATTRRYPPFALGLLGEHQAANAAVAVATIERLRAAGLSIPDAAVARGLAGVRWPARVEVLAERPALILDCAHNVPSAEALVATLRQSFAATARKACVFAVSMDKPYAEMLRVLAGYFDHFHLTRYGNNPRCVPPEALAGLLPAGAATVHPTAAGGWTAATEAAGPDDLVCVTGSVFLAGEIRELLDSRIQSSKFKVQN
jgi:dihydrofolate synthase/folylpolyglutamate synthase